MTAADSRSMVLVLRAWLDGEDGDRNANRLAEYVIEKAISGHFGFFKLLLDMVDGPIDRESDEGRIFPDDRTLIMIDDQRDSEIAEAA
ncbi:MAG: hypothetical protein WBX00_24700 [Isosphaeraceae bacterium]